MNQGPGSTGATSGGTAIGTLAYQRRPEAAGLPVRLAPRPILAGREDLLTDLDSWLTPDPERPGPRVVALCGLGGAGKTSVATEFAYRQLGTVGVCWQFSAEDPAVLAAEFGVLAAQLRARDLVDSRDPVAAVHAVLARQAAGWLVVLENAADLASVERFLPPAGRGRVLITSQNQHWPPGWAVQVPMLDAVVAAEFLLARTADTDQAAAEEVAEAIGGLPLALEQAAAYMQATGTSLAGYAGLFRKRQAELLARGEAAGHREHVAATLGLALSKLEADATAAAGLVRLLAFLAPDPVPLGLLLAGPDSAAELPARVAQVVGSLLGDSLAIGDAVAALRRYSLVTVVGDGVVLMHRLVQAISLDQMRAERATQWRQAAAALIEAAIPADTDLPESWPVCAVLVAHARTTLADASSGMERIANYLGNSGSYSAGRDLQQRIADAYRQALGTDHPKTLTARGNLASLIGDAGDSAGARDQYAVLLPVEERILGADHPSTLTTRANLAGWTGMAGDPAGARDQYAALLPIQERILGADHPSTLTTRANTASWIGKAGDPVSARNRYVMLLPIEERIWGAEHPATLGGRANLAWYTGEAGDPARARDQYAALLPTAERVLGAEHPDNLALRTDLARWTGEAGDAAMARDQLAALLLIQERISGTNHPNTLRTRTGLARWAEEAGDPARARDQYAALLPTSERILGAEHPDNLALRTDLARWTGEAGDAAMARDQYAVLLSIVERVRGAEHPDTLRTRANLAYWTEQADIDGLRNGS